MHMCLPQRGLLFLFSNSQKRQRTDRWPICFRNVAASIVPIATKNGALGLFFIFGGLFLHWPNVFCCFTKSTMVIFHKLSLGAVKRKDDPSYVSFWSGCLFFRWNKFGKIDSSCVCLMNPSDTFANSFTHFLLMDHEQLTSFPTFSCLSLNVLENSS